MKSEMIRLGKTEIYLETGRIANQADGSVIVRQGRSAVLVTVVSNKEARPDIDFFPLTVDYRELFGAAGVIPHSYGRREGRLSDREILACRIIDRSIRPIFPEGFTCETQIIATVLSADPDVETDVLGLIGATAALHLSDVPWKGPACGIRIARVNGQFIINPLRSERACADIDLVVSSGNQGLIMVEGHAREVSEKDILTALETAQSAVQPLLILFDQWQKELEIRKRSFDGPENPCLDAVREAFLDKLQIALQNVIKRDRHEAVKSVRDELIEHYNQLDPERLSMYLSAFEDMKYYEVRRRIIEENNRLDGRNTTQVRPISGEVDVVPYPHGSALFTRGETQAFVTCTLAPLKELLRLETIHGDIEHSFFLHYDFPPYSVGEVRPVKGPGRREIGHGNLAWRALLPVIPPTDQFPYAIRVFSEITQSNGSSSMATVCGGCLSLMDAGVPILRPVSGVAMGLIAQEGEIRVLTDILGDEDHLGDMDFKVAGTCKGITAIQMDNKIGHLPNEVLEKALSQARAGVDHILGEMAKVIDKPKPNLKPHAPRAIVMSIRPEKVKDVIGPGGKVIKDIQAVTGATLEIEDDGTLRIYATNESSARDARERVEYLTQEARVGHYYHGTVISIKSFGMFVEIFPGTEGLVHISELDQGFVDDPTRIASIGDKIPIKVLGVDEKGKIRLSRKEALNVGNAVFDN